MLLVLLCLAYLGACCACCAVLGFMLEHLGTMFWGLLAYVGPSWDYVGRSWVLCWAILALSWGHLGTMLGFVGSSWAYVGPAWDYVGRSWVLCWAILALCWPILGHVARCSNLTPCNSPQRAVFTVIYSVFCTFPTPILTPKSLQITLPPHPPMAAADNVSAFPTLSVITLPPPTPHPIAAAENVSAFPTLSVGRSWVVCWVISTLCWPILGHVPRCSNLTPWNSPKEQFLL